MRLGRVSALPGAAVGPPPRDRAVGGARGGRRPPRGGARGVERAGRVGRAELRSPLPRARKCPRPRGNSRQFCRDVRHSADTTTKDIGRPVVKIAKINNFARAGGPGGAGRRGGRRGRVGANFLKHLTRAHAPPVRLPPLLTPPPWKPPASARERARQNKIPFGEASPGPTRAELQAGLGALTAEKAARADTLAGTGRPRSSDTRTTSATWLMTWATRCKS